MINVTIVLFVVICVNNYHYILNFIIILGFLYWCTLFINDNGTVHQLINQWICSFLKGKIGNKPASIQINA